MVCWRRCCGLTEHPNNKQREQKKNGNGIKCNRIHRSKTDQRSQSCPESPKQVDKEMMEQSTLEKRKGGKDKILEERSG